MDLSRRTVFDQFASLYDEARPGYPEALVEDVVSLSRIPSGGRILEIGCGPGKATLPFARRGFDMVCLELGERLAALAAAHCSRYPKVHVLHTSFEEWPLEEGVIDLVMSAQAFHWVAPEIGYPRAAAALRDSGAIALFWNHQRVRDPVLLQALEAVYWEHAPELVAGARPRPVEALERETAGRIEAAGLFGPVAIRRYPWSACHKTDLYVKGVCTSSAVLTLQSATRQRLLSGISEVVEAHGGEVELGCVSTLYLAHVQRAVRSERRDL